MQVALAQAQAHPHSLSAYLDRIFTETCHGAPRLAVAVSGGCDSMALALLAHEWATARGIAIHALTVDHQLRPESAAEAQQVQQWMRAHRIDHTTLTPVADATIANLQTRARAMRYRALAEYCTAHDIGHLLLAHHADDQAETLLLQQHRGDSPPSRSGMALVRSLGSLAVVRPLLGVRKRDLLHYLTQQRQPWINDPSNQNLRYARNRLRQRLGDAEIVAAWHTAQRMGQQRQRDETARNAWLAAHAQPLPGGVQFDAAAWQALAAALRTDLLSHAILRVGGKPFRPRLHETMRLDAQLRANPRGQATLGHCVVAWDAAQLRIVREPSRQQALDMAANDSHITAANPPIALGNMPFWWFNHPLF